MSVTLEIKTKNYVDDLLSIKKSLSHMETIVEQYNGYVLSEPETKFGWIFFKLAFKPNLQTGIEEKFADMLVKYPRGDQPQKFAKFMIDYFHSRDCDAVIKAED
jgi:hypothetical protein